ncbi:MMPL family transporter [Amnibacterium endophyticum]|uniref:MMPL family transporter n=1 Tax=Amnibacterium endophyticum TaxID=2109337 RepID=A0ABW4LIS4_9MICO
MASLLYRLGRFAARRHWTVIVTWIVLLALGGVGYGVFGGTISSSISIPGTATSKVTDELARKFPSASGGSGSLVFETTDGSPFTAEQKTAVKALLDDVADETGVRSTVDPFAAQQQLDDRRAEVAEGRQQLEDGRKQLRDAQQQLDQGQQQLDAAQQQLDQRRAQAGAAGQLAAAKPQLDAAQQQLDEQQKTLDANQRKLDDSRKTLSTNEERLAVGERLLALSKGIRLVSEDGSAAVGTVQFRQPTISVPPAVKQSVVDAADDAGIDGVDVYVSNEIAQSVPSIIGPGEVVGLAVAAVVLLLILTTVVGAVLPLASALLGVGVALLGALSFSSLVQFISVTPFLGVMLGLAVGIDYSLFILNRHRNQLKQGVELHESIGLANGTSGTAVVFAGSTVVVALLALNITGIPFLGLMGTVGAVAVLVAVLVAVSFTPALLSLVGLRILRRKERAAIGHEHASRVPDRPMSTLRALGTLVAGVAVLAVIALPALQMRLGLPDGSSEPVDSSQYKAYSVISEKFGAGQNSPLLVVADLPRRTTGNALLEQEATIGERIAAQDHVSALAPIGASDDGTVVAFQVLPTTGPTAPETETLVHDLRDLSPVSTADGPVDLGVAGNASANIDISENLGAVLPLYLAVVIGLSLIILIIVFRSILVPVTATLGFVLSLFATFGALTAVYQFGWLGPVFGVHDPGPILSFLPIIEIGVLFGLAMDYQLFLVSGMREAFAHGAPARLAVQRGLHAGRAVVTAAALIMTSVFAGFVFSEATIVRPIGFGLAFGVLVDAFVVRMLLIPAAMHLLGRSAWWLPRWLDRIIPDVDVEGASLERTHPHPGAQVQEPEPAGR